MTRQVKRNSVCVLFLENLKYLLFICLCKLFVTNYKAIIWVAKGVYGIKLLLCVPNHHSDDQVKNS